MRERGKERREVEEAYRHMKTHSETNTCNTHTHRGSSLRGVRGGEIQVHADSQIHKYKHTKHTGIHTSRTARQG